MKSFWYNPLYFLGFVLIILKLTHYIDWSWIIVTSPFWIGIAFFVGLIIIPIIFVSAGAIAVGVVYLILEMVEWINRWYKNNKTKNTHKKALQIIDQHKIDKRV